MIDHDNPCRCPACHPTPLDLFIDGAVTLGAAVLLASVMFALGAYWFR
jgi:hypothetical protein